MSRKINIVLDIKRPSRANKGKFIYSSVWGYSWRNFIKRLNAFNWVDAFDGVRWTPYRQIKVYKNLGKRQIKTLKYLITMKEI